MGGNKTLLAAGQKVCLLLLFFMCLKSKLPAPQPQAVSGRRTCAGRAGRRASRLSAASELHLLSNEFLLLRVDAVRMAHGCKERCVIPENYSAEMCV